MFLDIINLAKVRRAVICALILLATVFLQEIVLSHIYILGVRAMIIPIAVVAIGFWNGGVWGGVFGLIAGVFTDMSLNTFSILMTIIFPIIGFFAGALPMYYMSRKLLSFFTLSFAALAITAFFQMFSYLVFSDTEALPLIYTALFQLLWSLPFIFVLFYPCRAVSSRDLDK